MPKNSKPRKKHRPRYRSKEEMLYVMKASGSARTAFNDIDAELLAKSAMNTLDRMKTNPDQNGLIDMADITNVLCDMIHFTDTDKKRRKYFNSPDIHFHLWNKGWRLVAKTINSMHYALYDIEKRVTEKQSFTINSEVMVLFDKIVRMYRDALDIAPKGLLKTALTDSRHSHREEKNKFRIAHFELDDKYYINEEVWDEMLEREERYAI